MRGGVGVRPGRDAQRAGGRQHHRRQQHDGRVQAQDRRGRRGDDEHRAAAAGADRRRCGRAIATPAAWNRPSSSQSFASTSTAARNPTTGSERLTSAARVVQRDRARGDQQRRGGHRRQRPPASPGGATSRTPARPRQRGERQQGQLHGSSRCHSVGRCSGTPSSRASASAPASMTSRSSPAYGNARSGSVERPEEVVPVDEHHAAGADRADRLGPVVDQVAPRLHAELPDAEVHDIGALAAERPGRSRHCPEISSAATAGPVLDQGRPGLTAPVGDGLTGGTTGAVIAPGNRSGGQWWPTRSG